MDKFELLEELGHGSYGKVWKAVNKKSGEIVAIKLINRKCSSWQQCLNLREVKSLWRMGNHSNVVQLKEVILENYTLFLVLECMEGDLRQVIKFRRPKNGIFSESEVKNLCFQVFHGLASMHMQGSFHRDLKPENLLVLNNTVKIGDLGSAREINSEPPYTEYVTTRWYRAPEVLLSSCRYTFKVDIWAMGAIMAELINLKPLFPGNNAADQMFKICKIIGSPTMDSWPDGLHFAKSIGYQFPEFCGTHPSSILPSASSDATSLISMLCCWDPRMRPTAAEALQNPFFHSCYSIPRNHMPREDLGISEAAPISSIRRDKKLLQAVSAHLLQYIADCAS